MGWARWTALGCSGGLAVAAVVAYCNATSSVRPAALYPRSGGTHVYGRERLGEFWGLTAGCHHPTGRPGRARDRACAVRGGRDRRTQRIRQRCTGFGERSAGRRGALVDVRGAIGFSSFAVLLHYAIANASAWTLGRSVIPVIGLAGCVLLAVLLPVSSVTQWALSL